MFLTPFIILSGIKQASAYRHTGAALLAALLLTAGSLHAQPLSENTPGLTLKQAFDTAWARQPEAQALTTQQDADEARQQSAESWTVEPPALELSARSDRANQRAGKREYVVGVALPLWLPGERSRTRALAEAETRLTTSRIQAAQLRTAETIRTAWWNWHRAYSEQGLAHTRLLNAQKLAADVARRVQAGDLSRADQHQSDGALAAAEAEHAAATGALSVATQALHSLTGITPAATDAAPDTVKAEPLPAVPVPAENGTDTSEAPPVNHPAILELSSRAEVARRNVDLARIQTRANPELTLATTHERDTYQDDYQQSITVGIRIPFGSTARNQTRIALAQSEAIEAEALARQENERISAMIAAEHARINAITAQLAATEKRTRLAHESRTFFQKAFQSGEIDLPTMLRIELETTEAERQAARTRIEHAAAISDFRQALGLLPE